MLELTLDCATLETCSPALPDEVQRHLGHLLAAAYKQDTVVPSINDRFADLLMRLDAALAQAEGEHETAFRAGLLKLVPALHRFAVSLTRDPVAADDLVQDTLLRGWRARATFAPGTNQEAWLFTILRNVFFTANRKRGREVQDVDGGYAERLVSVPEQSGHLDLQDVNAALDQLLPIMREALILVTIENLSYEEAATAMRCQIGTVKSRVWRARRQLAQTLGYADGDVGADDITLAAMAGHTRKTPPLL